MSARATTIRWMKRNARRAPFMALWLAAAASAQTFSAAPVIFAPTGSNSVLAQQVNVKLTVSSTIRSITIPLPLAAQPEFYLDDHGGCAEDGTTVNAAGTVCSLIVRFHPAAPGLRTAALVITDGSGNATAIPISGVGYYSQISVIPSAMKVVAGQGPTRSGLHGDGAAAILANLNSPHGIAADSFGNIYIADTGNNVVRMLDAFGNITTVAGGGTLSGVAADGGPATAALLVSPTWLAIDPAGNLYITETGNHVVRRVAMSTSHVISTVAGGYAQGFSGDGGAATSAKLGMPQGIAVDPAGNLYIADSGNQRIRRVDATTATITTFAGSGTAGFNASSTPTASAQFSAMSALAFDTSGNLFVADTGNHAVRKISNGTVTVVAGTGAAGYSGDGGAATAALLTAPAGLALSPAGDVYVSDQTSGTVRKVQASDSTIETVAGNVSLSSFTSGVGPSLSTALNAPLGLAFDTASNLLVADSANNVLRALSPSPAELSFATQAAGTSSVPQTFRIENIGNAALTLVSTAAANTATSSNFTLTNPSSGACGSSVASGAHCNYSVTYTPAANGAVTGEFDVTYQSKNPNFNSVAPIYATGGIASSLTITPTTLAPVVVNTSASVPITTTGGIGAVTLDLEGTLPTGMTSAMSGGTLTLSGTPTQAGSYELTAFADDALGASATQAYTLQILPAMVPLNLSETVHVNDSIRSFLPLPLTVSETVHVLDTPTELPFKSLVLSETVHVTDLANTIAPISLVVTEAIHVNDAARETPSITLAITEAIHTSDAAIESRALMLAVTEAIHVADAQRELLPVALSVTEKIHTSDSPVENPAVMLSIIEGIHIADADMNVPASSLTVNEAIHVADLVKLNVGQASQTITAPIIPNHLYGDAAFPVAATASSGLPVRISISSGPARITSGLVDLTGAGVVTLDFNQAGDANTAAAKTVQRTFNVSPAIATVTAQSGSRIFETPNPTFTYALTGLVHGDNASVVSGAPVFTTTAVLNSLGGSYPINVVQGSLSAANYMFNFASGTLTVVGHTPQTIMFNKLPDVPLSADPLTLSAHSTSSLPVTYTVTGPATVSGIVLHLTGAGTVTVKASQSGNGTFDPATPITRSFTVKP